MARARSKAAEVSLAEAAQQRAAAAQDQKPVDPRVRQLLDALASERCGYVTRGLTDRVAQVDAQIKRIGG